MNVILHPSHTYYVNNYERIIQKYNFYNNNNNIIIIIIIIIVIKPQSYTFLNRL